MSICRAMDKTTKEELIKKAIIEASKKVFQRHGFNKVTMEDISKATKKARSSIYYYFKNKEDIFEAVVLAEMKELLDKLEASVEAEPTAAEKLRAFVLKKYKLYKNKANFYPILSEELEKNECILPRFKKIYIEQKTALFKGIIMLGIENKEFAVLSESDVDFMAESFVLGFSTTERDILFTNMAVDYTEKLEMLVKMLLKGLR